MTKTFGIDYRIIEQSNKQIADAFRKLAAEIERMQTEITSLKSQLNEK